MTYDFIWNIGWRRPLSFDTEEAWREGAISRIPSNLFIRRCANPRCCEGRLRTMNSTSRGAWGWPGAWFICRAAHARHRKRLRPTARQDGDGPAGVAHAQRHHVQDRGDRLSRRGQDEPALGRRARPAVQRAQPADARPRVCDWCATSRRPCSSSLCVVSNAAVHGSRAVKVPRPDWKFGEPNQFLRAQVWDTVGQERFQAISSSHYRRANGTQASSRLTL